MKLSKLFFKTLREAPSEAEVESHKLLVRAGFVRQLASGIFSELPLGKRSITKIEQIIREEMDKICGQEMSMPVVHPAEIWKETSRWFQIGLEMGRFKDRNNRDMVLAMTHEEVVADLVRKDIRTYRQLPRLIYHFKTKWRDEARPRAGLIRVREFTMKDSYSLDRDWEGLDIQYKNHYQAYFNIFNRCGLPTIAVKSDVGMMGGQVAHEFMYLNPIGEDTILYCKQCMYSANRQVAIFTKKPDKKESLGNMEKVFTPDIKTIEALSKYMKIPTSKMAKSVIFHAKFTDESRADQIVIALTRGDFEINETKVGNAVQAKELRPASEEEMIQYNLVPGYASPIGIKDVITIVDDIIVDSTNLVAGANKENYHLLNVNIYRDFNADIIADISSAQSGFICPKCSGTLESERGVELGNIFKLGTKYSESMGCKYLDKNGHEKLIVMGSYGIGSGRLLQCVVEEHHDLQGIIWPITISPYHVHLILLQGRKDITDLFDKAENIYSALNAKGIETLFDDRTENPGIKFNDADLIGVPIRIILSKNTHQNKGVEIKLRKEDSRIFVAFDQIVPYIIKKIDELKNEIYKTVVEVPYYE